MDLKTFFIFTCLASLAFANPEPSKPKNFPLVNQDGKPFQFGDLKGKYTFVSFIFTRCPLPKMCPLTVTRVKELQRKWKAAPGNKPLQFLFVTLDPDFDTAGVLKKFAKDRRLDLSHTILATGNPQVLSDLASEFNVMGVPSGGTIAHNMKSILLGPDLAELKQYKDNEWTAEQVLNDLQASPKL